MTRRAPVFRWLFDEAARTRTPVRVGELTQETSRWEFRYDKAYLARDSDAWELDPTFIRTKQGAPYIRTGSLPPPVFCDIAVSGWALDALRRQSLGNSKDLDDAEPWGWWERLLYAPADGFGSLFVGELDEKPLVVQSLYEAVTSAVGVPWDNALADSSSGVMGGERPKFTVYADRGNDAVQAPLLLKFALPSERSDSVVAEATALTLAHELGMQVPVHGVRWFGDVPALSIERFDRAPGMHGQVFHCVSAATALDLLPGSDVDDPRCSYIKLRSRLKRQDEGLELFRRVVFNAVIGNTDDHPWNTSLRQRGLGDWELSPLYDVMPFFRRKGCPVARMAITNRGGRAATAENLVAAGRALAGLAAADALALVHHSIEHVQNRWQDVFLQHAGPGANPQSEEWRPVFEHDWL